MSLCVCGMYTVNRVSLCVCGMYTVNREACFVGFNAIAFSLGALVCACVRACI